MGKLKYSEATPVTAGSFGYTGTAESGDVLPDGPVFPHVGPALSLEKWTKFSIAVDPCGR